MVYSFFRNQVDKFFRMENVSVQKEGECFCVVCSVGNYGIVNKNAITVLWTAI